MWYRIVAGVLGVGAGLWTLLAAYSLVTTLWRQLAYGGDAMGPAWWRMLIQLSCLLAGLLLGWLCSRAWKAKPPA